MKTSASTNMVFPGALAQKTAPLVPFPPVMALVHTAVMGQWLCFCISPLVMSRFNHQSYESSSKNDRIYCAYQGESDEVIHLTHPVPQSCSQTAFWTG